LSGLIEPYGGRLVDCLAGEKESERIQRESQDLPRIHTILDQIYDAEKIGIGAYSPLEGFMCSSDYQSVLLRGVLSNGLPWSMPVILTPTRYDGEFGAGDTIALTDLEGNVFATVQVEDIFTFDRKSYAQNVYGTSDPSHPNVAELPSFGDRSIGGRVRLLKRLKLPSVKYELTPKETREYFAKMGWRRVAGYQARNPPHTAHEYIQRVTLEREDVDALFIQPIVGKLKKGDYKPEIIMKAYEAFVSNYYTKERVLLGSLSIAMRYAGPKAVLFYAIIRRNYGCSHYIVGRDQAGVGSFYDPYAAHRIFDTYDVGVVPLRYQESFYCLRCGMMASSKICPHTVDERLNVSQTKIRRMLAEKEKIPEQILRPEVARILSEPNVMIE
jgi:sulfate adenylyltransferase